MNEHSTCAIWGTPVITSNSNERDGRLIDSPRTGGKYFVTGTAEVNLRNYDDHKKVKLTTWLVEQRFLGNLCPEITSDTLKYTEKYGNKKISDRTDGILKYLEKHSELLGTGVTYSTFANLYNHMNLSDSEKIYLELLSHSGCIGRSDFSFLMDYLKNRNLIDCSSMNHGQKTCILTMEGYARLSELENTYKASSRAFVAMWFDESMSAAWKHGFDPAIREAGYEPVRIDQQEHVNKIDDEIISEIRRSRFVVADFTHGTTGVRGGVYYEAGFAHGLNIPVIFTCREDFLDKIHFDTRQYNHLVWTEPNELRKNLTRRISAVVGDGPSKSLDS